MTPQRWAEVRTRLGEALDLPPEARDAFVEQLGPEHDEVRGEVEELLACEAEAEQLLPEDAIAAGILPAGLPPPRTLGAYRTVREIARGGMGVVFEGERSDGQFVKRVALKLLSTAFVTPVLRRRFLRERQILAQLEHPNIARLLDGGITPNGEPYLVMEFVEGEPITAYVKRKRLTVPERVKLFLRVCAAVSHAHGRLIVHRDLKPGNILVTDAGTVKLLDFGLARVVNPDLTPEVTETVLRFMTPAYASPEQVRGEPFTVVGDVFSLGVVLYELLADRRPFGRPGATSEEVRQAICEQDPAPIARRAISSDLHTIMRKAMDKDSRRRYLSVESFAADLANYLAGRPILARPASVPYRAAKFLRRHRWPILASTVAASALIAGGLIAASQARRAQRRFDDVRQLATSVVFELHDAVADIPGSTKARELIVRRGLEYLDRLSREAGNDADLWRQLSAGYLRLGDAQGNPSIANLGDRDGARGSYRKAAEILERLHARRPEDRPTVRELVRALHRLANLTDDVSQSTPLFLRALALSQAECAAHPHDLVAQRDLAGCIYWTGQAYAKDRRYLESAREYRKALAIYRDLDHAHSTPETRRDLAVCLKHLAAVAVMSGDLAEALASYQSARDIDEATLVADPKNSQAQLDLSYDLSDLGITFVRLQQPARATEAFDRALTLRREAFAVDRNDKRARQALTSILTRRGMLLAQQSRLRSALQDLLEAEELSGVRTDPSAEAPAAGEIEFQLSGVYEKLGQPGSAFTHRQIALRCFSAAANKGGLMPNQRSMYAQLTAGSPH